MLTVGHRGLYRNASRLCIDTRERLTCFTRSNDSTPMSSASLDWLSRLLQLIPVSGRVEIRCSYGAPWRVAYDQATLGEMPYHIILNGEAVLESPHGGSVQTLLPGNIVLLPHGSEHVLHDGSGRKPARVLSRNALHLEISENRGKGQHLDMLCGRFILSPQHYRIISTYLPTTMVVRVQRKEESVEGDAAPTQLRALVEMMRSESITGELGASAILDALSAALFALMLRTASQTGAQPAGILALAGQPRLAPALNAMFNDPGHPWALEELAELCHMSRATLIRQFKDKVGRSAAELLLDIRMTIAADALRDPLRSTEQIAEEVGYQSPAAFRRAFTRHLRMTPGEWRRIASVPDGGVHSPEPDESADL
jgi:AraC family transcriptional regulator, activator of mtrCDE